MTLILVYCYRRRRRFVESRIGRMRTVEGGCLTVQRPPDGAGLGVHTHQAGVPEKPEDLDLQVSSGSFVLVLRPEERLLGIDRIAVVAGSTDPQLLVGVCESKPGQLNSALLDLERKLAERISRRASRASAAARSLSRS